MSPAEAALVALGAGVGACLRFLAGHLLDGRFPWGTLLVNVTGSFLLGWLSGLALGGAAWALLGPGFCGAFTTYSAFAVRTHDLGLVRGAGYAAATVVLAVAACSGGFALAAG